ncbi:pyridoxal kinase PdxY [Propionibacterium cyclohexanicum]|nr:pyridoxal kinase PdxY [Propionibacterium cyclohexanicum]
MAQIVSIQSAVSYGFVGNSAATFALRRMGIDCWPVPTVALSNHNGYPTVHGIQLSPRQVEDIVAGLDERGVLGSVDALLTGYLPDEAMGRAVLRIAQLVRRRNPAARICCDPVMGERSGGLYCQANLPAFFAGHLVPSCWLATPNLFELETLTGCSTSHLDEVVAAARQLLDRGPEVVLVTSVEAAEVTSTGVAMIAVTPAGAWYVQTPRQPGSFSGCGDLTAAVFLARLLERDTVAEALAFTAGAVHAVLSGTAGRGGGELALVAHQDELVRPPQTFRATRIA